jgi:hypothetical protein
MRTKLPEFGETRIIKVFLVLPRTIERETRSLETAYIKQEYVHLCGWEDREWVDDVEYKPNVL